MRNFSPELAAAIAAPSQRVALCAELLTATAPLRLTTWPADLVYEGQSYKGVGDLLGVSGISEEGDLSAAAVEITLSGVPSEHIARAMTEVIYDRTLTLHGVWLDGAGAVIGGFPRYVGRASVYGHNDDPVSKTSTLTLRTENRLVDFQRPSDRKWTHADQTGLVSAWDTFFENVEGLQDLDLGLWGVPPNAR